MKLVVIMSAAAGAAGLEKLYAEHRVPVYSETDIQGFRLEDTDLEERGWFGGGHTPIYSKLTFAFVAENKAVELMAAIQALNETLAPEQTVSAFQMDVEKSI